MNRNKVGKFVISEEVLEGRPEVVQLILSQVVVLDATYDPVFKVMHYTGVCQDFEAMVRGGVVPIYTVTLEDRNDGATILTWGLGGKTIKRAFDLGNLSGKLILDDRSEAVDTEPDPEDSEGSPESPEPVEGDN